MPKAENPEDKMAKADGLMAGMSEAVPGRLETSILYVRPSTIHMTPMDSESNGLVEDWSLSFSPGASQEVLILNQAAQELRETDVPVAFPTETVYGLGADATRSSAVQGIFHAKQRPSDNPLIVHVQSLRQLRMLLKPSRYPGAPGSMGKHEATAHAPKPNIVAASGGMEVVEEIIPAIYIPLIKRFWPGPLTLIVPNPADSVLAPEVTAGLSTVGVRMPKNVLALALIKLAEVPLAAPSANASTKPSPTTAHHVKHDLEGRITTIIDGGPCDVGVESTVVDGLTSPPLILRPGGISIEELRTCKGWEAVEVGYKDASSDDLKPRAPGMKYRHYSPKATVVLFEPRSAEPGAADILKHLGTGESIGVIRTTSWPPALGQEILQQGQSDIQYTQKDRGDVRAGCEATLEYARESQEDLIVALPLWIKPDASRTSILVWDLALEGGAEKVARGLFSALRELDQRGVHAIFVEGIDDGRGDVAAAVMNRLRKAAEVTL